VAGQLRRRPLCFAIHLIPIRKLILIRDRKTYFLNEMACYVTDFSNYQSNPSMDSTFLKWTRKKKVSIYCSKGQCNICNISDVKFIPLIVCCIHSIIEIMQNDVNVSKNFFTARFYIVLCSTQYLDEEFPDYWIDRKMCRMFYCISECLHLNCEN